MPAFQMNRGHFLIYYTYISLKSFICSLTQTKPLPISGVKFFWLIFISLARQINNQAM